MRLTNPLHYTEHHRFYVCRDFSLSPLDNRMLTSVYQPMIGPAAIGLYGHMYQRISADSAGGSRPEQQRGLFLAVGLEPNEAGRRQLASLCSLLEAVGLLGTTRIELTDSDEYVYEYELFAPLGPAQFFRTEHLFLLLRDKLGQYAAQALRGELLRELPEEAGHPYALREELSAPFYEIFRVAHKASLAAGEQPVAAEPDKRPPAFRQEARLRYEDIVSRFPKAAYNRRHVERLRDNTEALAVINYIADKYMLTLKEVCLLLDEDGVFTLEGALLREQFERHADSLFQQGVARGEQREWEAIRQLSAAEGEAAAGAAGAARPEAGAAGAARPEAVGERGQGGGAAQAHVVGGAAGSGSDAEQRFDGAPQPLLDVPDWLADRYDKAAYNRLLAEQPYTQTLRVLIADNVSQTTLRLFAKLNLYYKLPDAVLNVLVHHLRVMNKPWKENYIDKVAASLQGQGVATFAEAVHYFSRELEALKTKNAGARSGSGSVGGAAQPGSGGRGAGYAGRAGSGRGGYGGGKPKLPIYSPPAEAERLTTEEEEELKRILHSWRSEGGG